LYINPNITLIDNDTVPFDEDKKNIFILEWADKTVDINDLRSSEREITNLEGIPEDQIYMAVYNIRSSVVLNA